VLTACAPAIHADELGIWNDTEYTVARSNRFTFTVEGGHRFGEIVGDLFDRRIGTKFDYEIGKDVRIEANYVLRNRDVSDSSVTENRLAAGISYPILKSAMEVEGRTLYERFLVPFSDFNRYKQEFEISQPGKTLSPWVYQQFLFRQGAGFVRSRSRVGFQWRRSGYSFKTAYQFESRSIGTAWAPRHAIFTELSIDQPLWLRE
jgi:hypothetical protein